MKNIINVTPGLIPIPPNGWGAVEKIIWELHNNLLKMGYHSDIKYLDDISDNTDIVHIHVANLALLAYEKGIPYYFTMHDHHAYLYGKESEVYKENLLAMKYSVKSFVPAKYLVDYFEGIPEYFSHGVNVEYFTPSTKGVHKILCVANNGYIGQQSADRKGFGIVIAAAQALNIPITIAGPFNNKNYFDANPSTYDKLTVLYDLNEEELLTLYKTHSIFVHVSELEAGHPNLTILEALSCGLPVVGTFEEGNSLNGMLRVTRSIPEVIFGIQEALLDYDRYSQLARQQAEELSWYNQTKKLITIYEGTTNTMRDILLTHYNTTVKTNKHIPMKLNYHNIDGMFVEILGGDNTKYDIKFINKKTNEVIYSTELQKNHWAKPNIKYYIDWKILVTNKTTGKTTEHHLNLTNQRVFICFESKSLGDTLAWIPYVEEFRKHHNCKVICSTFLNKLVKDEYPEIEFVEPGQSVDNLRALYRIGLFYTDSGVDYNMHPINPISVPLQKVCTDILGLPFMEIQPRITSSDVNSNENSKQVSIGIHSTAQSKYWNNPSGWQTIVDWLTQRGYVVKLLSQEEDGYMGNYIPKGVIRLTPGPIENVIKQLQKSKLFIGVSSGLSWLSWAANVRTVIISGFTEPFNEMEDCIRIAAPKGKCSGCWHRHKFNPGDWNWCPDHKDTPRQFECSNEITAEMVIKELEKIL